MKRKIHENSLANLKPIQPGEVRNPDGMKKGTVHFKTILQKVLDEGDQTIYVRDSDGKVLTDERTGMPIVDKIVTKADAIAVKLVELALMGDLKAITEVINRVDGMPVQELKRTPEDSGVAYTVNIKGSKSPLLEKLNGNNIVDVAAKPHPKTSSQAPKRTAKKIVRRVVKKKKQ